MNKLYHDRLLYFWTKLIGCFPPATAVSVLPGYPVTWTHNLFGHKTPATENNGQRKQSHYFQSNDMTYKKPISGQFLASKMLVKLHKKYTIHYYNIWLSCTYNIIWALTCPWSTGEPEAPVLGVHRHLEITSRGHESKNLRYIKIISGHILRSIQRYTTHLRHIF